MNTTLSSNAEFTILYVFDLFEDNGDFNLELIKQNFFCYFTLVLFYPNCYFIGLIKVVKIYQYQITRILLSFLKFKIHLLFLKTY